MKNEWWKNKEGMKNEWRRYDHMKKKWRNEEDVKKEWRINQITMVGLDKLQRDVDEEDGKIATTPQS